MNETLASNRKNPMHTALVLGLIPSQYILRDYKPMETPVGEIVTDSLVVTVVQAAGDDIQRLETIINAGLDNELAAAVEGLAANIGQAIYDLERLNDHILAVCDGLRKRPDSGSINAPSRPSGNREHPAVDLPPEDAEKIEECPICSGTGRLNEHRCPTCAGHGTVILDPETEEGHEED
jgi:hypothetical protein